MIVPLSKLPKELRAEVKASADRSAEYNKVKVIGYTVNRSYYNGTQRLLISAVIKGRPAEGGWMVAEIYSGRQVNSAVFGKMWEEAAF